MNRASISASLMRGRVPLSLVDPFPLMASGRKKQAEELLKELRKSEQSKESIRYLRSWDLLTRVPLWSMPMRVRVLSYLGQFNPSAALSLICHTALGTSLIEHFNEKRLGSVPEDRAAGKVFAYAMTEETPASDLGGIQTMAAPVEGGFLVNGRKSWVTNAVTATHFIVLCRTHHFHPGEKPGLTALLLQRDQVHVTPLDSPVLKDAGIGQIVIKDALIPRTRLIGKEGKGVQVAMKGLAEARLLIASAVLGACLSSYNSCLEMVERRRAFGRRIARFPTVQASTSRMLGTIFALESHCLATAGLETADQGDRSVDHGIVRLLASQTASTVIELSRELHGVSAYDKHEDLRSLWGDCRALTLLDGSDYALHSFIALEATREIRDELIETADADSNMAKLDLLGVQTLARMRRKVHNALTSAVPGADLKELEIYSVRFSETVYEILRVSKEDFIELQHFHRRIALLFVDLSAWLAIAGRLKTEVERHGETGSRRMIDSAAVWLVSAKRRIESHLVGLKENADSLRNRVATRAYADKAYPFESQ